MKYSGLRALAGLYTLLGVVLIVAGVLLGIALITSQPGVTNPFAQPLRNPLAAPAILAGVLSIAFGVMSGLVFIGFGDVCRATADIAENSEDTVDLLVEIRDALEKSNASAARTAGATEALAETVRKR